MDPPASPAYPFGDLLAVARQSWVARMAREVGEHGYGEYRVTDAGAVRLLLRGPAPVGRLGAVLGVTRQAARKVARGLEARGLATTEPDPDDARKVNVRLTASGRAYGRVLREVIAGLNRELAARVDPSALAAADAVLRSAITEERLAATAARIPPPPVPSA